MCVLLFMTCHLLKKYFFGNLRNFLEERLIFGILRSGDNVTTEMCYSNYCSFGRFKLAIFGRLKYLIFGTLQYFNFREIELCHFWEIERCHFREIEISHFREITILQFLGDWNVSRFRFRFTALFVLTNSKC